MSRSSGRIIGVIRMDDMSRVDAQEWSARLDDCTLAALLASLVGELAEDEKLAETIATQPVPCASAPRWNRASRVATPPQHTSANLRQLEAELEQEYLQVAAG